MSRRSSSSGLMLNAPYGEKLRWVGQLFMKDDKVYETMRRLARQLEEAGIEYAVVCCTAVAEHGLLRVTQDVDLMMTPADLGRFAQQCRALGYMPTFEGARKTFVDADVQDLIQHLKLSVDFGEKLDPSVRNAYHERWRAAQSAMAEEDL